MDKVRVMRILVYEGDRDWVETAMKMSVVPLEGTKIIGNGCIKSAIIDKFPEVIDREVIQ